jgi:hypothetical protein
LAVARIRRKLDETEAKMRVVKHWRQIYDNRTGPLLLQLEPMFFRVGQQLPKAVHTLGESIKALQAYAESNRPSQPKPAPPASPDPPAPETVP